MGNLKFGVSEDQLREAFNECGKIEDLHLNERGFAFITFADAAGAKSALEWNDTEFQGRRVSQSVREGGSRQSVNTERPIELSLSACVCVCGLVAHQLLGQQAGLAAVWGRPGTGGRRRGRQTQRGQTRGRKSLSLSLECIMGCSLGARVCGWVGVQVKSLMLVNLSKKATEDDVQNAFEDAGECHSGDVGWVQWGFIS